MRFYRIGDKVVSWERLLEAVGAILEDRQAGATQEEAARHAHVQRSFVSFLETLGEVRRGPKVALVAFPVANGEAIHAVADRHAVDLTIVVSQAEREGIEHGDASSVFNRLLDTLAALRDFDTVVLLASDQRIATIEKILGAEIVGMRLGQSPIREDATVDLDELDRLLEAVMASGRTRRRPDRVGDALREAAEIAGRWTQSKRS